LIRPTSVEPKFKRMNRYRFLAIIAVVLGLALFGGGLWGMARAYAQPQPPEHPLATPTVEMPPLPQGLDPPPTVYPPTQVSQGSYVYYMVCMACHGDKGQGLTDEWRGALDEPDQNCWQSKCHHSNYPPGGFVFPKFVPAVAGPIMIARFQTGQDLYEYIKENMPYQAPGSLDDAEYWQLTAFLLQLNGIDPGREPLDAGRAAQVYLRDPPTPTPLPPFAAARASLAGLRAWGWLAAGALLGLALVFVAVLKPFKR
jgi:hypothetical protein